MDDRDLMITIMKTMMRKELLDMEVTCHTNMRRKRKWKKRRMRKKINKQLIQMMNYRISDVVFLNKNS